MARLVYTPDGYPYYEADETDAPVASDPLQLTVTPKLPYDSRPMISDEQVSIDEFNKKGPWQFFPAIQEGFKNAGKLITGEKLPVEHDVEQTPLNRAFETTLRSNPLTAGLAALTTDPNTGVRYQTWPEKMVRNAIGGAPAAFDPVSGHTTEQTIERAQDISGMMGGGSVAGGAATRGLEPNALGIVPVPRAKELNVKTGVPSEQLKAMVENTPGASIDPDGHLIVNVSRRQRPEQELSESVRGGVFYLPTGSRNLSGYTGKHYYGGQQKITGETAYKNPLVVKGATGGKAPEVAFSQLMGKEAMRQLDRDVMEVVNRQNVTSIPDGTYVRYELTRRFLEKYAPELIDNVDHIIDNSRFGNQFRYALQEAAIGSAVRKAGHDGVVGYSLGRGGKGRGKPFISEIFDVRESQYPSPSGDYNVHPQFLSDTSANAPISALAKAPRFYSALENAVKDLTPASERAIVETEAFMQGKGAKELAEKVSAYRKENKDKKAGELNAGIEKLKKDYRSENEARIRSELEKQGLPEIAKTGPEWVEYLRKQPGVKPEEIDWVLHELPEGKLTKAELEQFIQEHKVELKEVVKGSVPLRVEPLEDEPHILQVYRADDPTGEISGVVGEIIKKKAATAAHEDYYQVNIPGLDRKKVFRTQKEAEDYISERTDFGTQTQHSSYQLPGGTNYREMILTLPEKNVPSQWNIVAHPSGNGFAIKNSEGYYGLNPHGVGEARFKTKQEAEVAKEMYSSVQPKYEFTHSHWPGITNPIAHVRTNERNIPVERHFIVEGLPNEFKTRQEAYEARDKAGLAGKANVTERNGLNTLHVEEVQSDLHQQARKKGYKGESEKLEPQFNKIEAKINKAYDAAEKAGNAVDIEREIYGNPDIKEATENAIKRGIITKEEGEIYKRYSQINAEQIAGERPIMDAPFKTGWADLALKRIIRQAAEEGKDAISWTPGEAQAARYDLSKHIKEIEYIKLPDKVKGEDVYNLGIVDINNRDIDSLPNQRHMTLRQIEENLGKEMAEKIKNQEGQKYRGHKGITLQGLDLKIGGEGMKAFYDKMLVDKANAIAKKFGGKVESANTSVDSTPRSLAHFLDWAEANGDTRSRSSLGQVWAKGLDDPTVAKFMSEQKKQPIHLLRLTPQLKDAALHKGFSLFADTGKVGAPLAALTRVEHNPFKLGELEQQHGVKLKPVEGNPFTVETYHGTPKPFKGERITNPSYEVERIRKEYRDEDSSLDEFKVWSKADRKFISPSFKNETEALNWIDKKGLNEFYSTTNKDLAHEYLGGGGFTLSGLHRLPGVNIMPLKVNTKDYHVYDAKGGDWYEHNPVAIKEANQLGKKGVIIKNVEDGGPVSDVYVTLDASTVRSKFAKFDPAKFGESGLLKAGGLPIYSDADGNQLIPPPRNPSQIDLPPWAIALGLKAGEYAVWLANRGNANISGPMWALTAAQWPLMSRNIKNEIARQRAQGKDINEIIKSIPVLDSIINYGKPPPKLTPIEGNPYAR